MATCIMSKESIQRDAEYVALLEKAVDFYRNVKPCGDKFQARNALMLVGFPYEVIAYDLRRFAIIQKNVDETHGKATFPSSDEYVVYRALRLAKLYKEGPLGDFDTERFVLLAGSALPHVHLQFCEQLNKLRRSMMPKQKYNWDRNLLSVEDIRRMSKQTRDIDLLISKAVETYRNVPTAGQSYSSVDAMVHVGISYDRAFTYFRGSFRNRLDAVKQERGCAIFQFDVNDILKRALSLLLLSHAGVLSKPNAAKWIRLAGGNDEHTKAGAFRQKFQRELTKLRHELTKAKPKPAAPQITQAFSIDCEWDEEIQANISPMTLTSGEVAARLFHYDEVDNPTKDERCTELALKIGTIILTEVSESSLPLLHLRSPALIVEGLCEMFHYGVITVAELEESYKQSVCEQETMMLEKDHDGSGVCDEKSTEEGGGDANIPIGVDSASVEELDSQLVEEILALSRKSRARLLKRMYDSVSPEEKGWLRSTLCRPTAAEGPSEPEDVSPQPIESNKQVSCIITKSDEKSFVGKCNKQGKGTPATAALISDDESSKDRTVMGSKSDLAFSKLTIASDGVSLLQAELAARGFPSEQTSTMRISELKPILKGQSGGGHSVVPLSTEIRQTSCSQ